MSKSRVIVFRIGNLGDSIVSLPAFYVIRRNFPNTFLALLSNSYSNSKHIGAKKIIPSGLFDALISYNENDDHLVNTKNRVTLLLELRKYKFDTLIYLVPRHRKPNQIRRDLLFFYAAGVRNFLGHKGVNPVSPGKIDGIPLPFIQSEAEHLVHRLSLSGLDTPADLTGFFDLGLTREERNTVSRWLDDNCSEAFTENRLVGIGPGSKWQSKIWPENNYLEIGRRLINELNLFPVILGGPEDRECGSRLISKWGNGVNSAGYLSVRESAALLAHCRMFVGNDSGIMHLSAAVNTPTVIPFSAQDWPGKWYPYGTQHIVLREPVPCEGCKLMNCDKGNLCLTLITVDRVFGACKEMLI